MLGSLILYLKSMRISMFQLSGFYCRAWSEGVPGLRHRFQGLKLFSWVVGTV